MYFMFKSESELEVGPSKKITLLEDKNVVKGHAYCEMIVLGGKNSSQTSIIY